MTGSNIETGGIGLGQWRNEANFLRRVPVRKRKEVLDEEMGTWVAEKVGLVSFLKDYDLVDGQLRDGSGWLREVVGQGVELEAVKIIEEGLAKRDGKMWVNFSPRNEEFGYTDNCVDVWRMIEIDGEKKVRWMRLVVEEGLEEMNSALMMLSGKLVSNETEMLASPVATSLRLAELWSMFKMLDRGGEMTLDAIKIIAEGLVVSFYKEYGEELFSDEKLLFRLYSAIYAEVTRHQSGAEILERGWADRFNGRMMEYLRGKLMVGKLSFSDGCPGSLMIGRFGGQPTRIENFGGQIKLVTGALPEGDWKLCNRCGLYYQGDKCPVCD